MPRAAFVLFALAAFFASPAWARFDIPHCRVSEVSTNAEARDSTECLGTDFAGGSARRHAARGERFLQLFFAGVAGRVHDDIVIEIITAADRRHFVDVFYGGREKRHLHLRLTDTMFTRIESDWSSFGAEAIQAKGEPGGFGSIPETPACSDSWETAAASNLDGRIRYFEDDSCAVGWIEGIGNKIAAKLSTVVPACDEFTRTDDIDELTILANCVWLRGDTHSAAEAAKLFLNWRSKIDAGVPTQKRRELFQNYAAAGVTFTLAGRDPVRGADAVFDAWEKLQPRGEPLPYMSLAGDATGSGDHAMLKGRAWIEWDEPLAGDKSKTHTRTISAPFSQIWVKSADGKWELSSWQIGLFVSG